MKISSFSHIIKAITVSGLLISGIASAQAATVQFSAAPANITPGTTFSLDILATDFSEILGGGLSISVDTPSILHINSASYSTPFWEDVFSNNGTANAATGKVSELGFGKFAGASGSFTIGTVSFTVLSSGSSIVSFAPDNFNGGFVFTGNDQPITFSPSTISVESAPVPVPAALWLFSSALGLLGFNTRKLRAA